MSLEQRGRLLFGAGMDHAHMVERFGETPAVKSTHLTKEFDYTAFQALHGESVLPLFLIRAGHDVAMFTVDNPPMPQAGEVMISLARAADDVKEDVSTKQVGLCYVLNRLTRRFSSSDAERGTSPSLPCRREPQSKRGCLLQAGRTWPVLPLAPLRTLGRARLAGHLGELRCLGHLDGPLNVLGFPALLLVLAADLDGDLADALLARAHLNLHNDAVKGVFLLAAAFGLPDGTAASKASITTAALEQESETWKHPLCKCLKVAAD